MLWEKFYYEYRAGDVSHQKNAKWKQNALSLSLHMCVCVCVCMCDVCVYVSFTCACHKRTAASHVTHRELSAPEN